MRTGSLLLIAAVFAAPLVVPGQVRRGDNPGADNPGYSGQFIFTRIRYDSPGGWRFGCVPA